MIDSGVDWRWHNLFFGKIYSRKINTNINSLLWLCFNPFIMITIFETNLQSIKAKDCNKQLMVIVKPKSMSQSPVLSPDKVWKTQKPNSLYWGWHNNHKTTIDSGSDTIDSGSSTIDSGSYTIDSGSHPQLLDSGSSPNSPITRALPQPKSSFQWTLIEGQLRAVWGSGGGAGGVQQIVTNESGSYLAVAGRNRWSS